MDQNRFEYRIGPKTYVQKALVLGQVMQLYNVLKGINFAAVRSAPDIVPLLGEQLPAALAVVLTEEGQSPRDKDLAALANDLEFEISPEQTIKVIEDFFGCNQVHLLIEKLGLASRNIMANLPTLKPSSSFSAGETSPKET
ncbi:MAG: hypothetical protein AB1427_00910 [Thermodesulfobacteriota bacterium]